MSQELTDAELAKWLRENVVHLFASWAYDGKFDQSFPDNLHTIAARLDRPAVTGVLFCGDDDKICGIDLDSAPEGFQPCDRVTVTINPAGPGGRE